MEIGTMEIIGTINVESIKMGLNQMKNSLSSAKVQAKSLFGDMERLGKTVAGMGKTMAVAGVGFLASLTAIATVSPGVQTAMERMKFEMFRIGMAVGNVVSPAFHKFADLLGDVASFAESHPWATIIVAGFISIASAIVWKLGAGSVARLAISGLIGLIGSIPLAPVITIAVIAGGAIATILYIKSLLDSLKRKKEIEIEARGGLPKEAFQQGMIGEGGTMELKPGYGLPIPTTGRGRTAEEAGLIFRESSKSEETTPKLEFPSEINVEQLIINTSNVERASN